MCGAARFALGVAVQAVAFCDRWAYLFTCSRTWRLPAESIFAQTCEYGGCRLHMNLSFRKYIK
jgi:hypothetical protein